MNIVYSLKHYHVYNVGHEFIIHNTLKPWKDGDDAMKSGHTHIRNKKTAIWLCNLAYHHTIPRTDCLYFYISLIRISDNKDYTEKLQHMYDVKLQKHNNRKYYININKGYKKKN